MEQNTSFTYTKGSEEFMDVCKISDEYEQLIADNQIAFSEAKLDDLPKFAQMIVSQFLPKFNWTLGNIKLGNSCCIKIGDAFLQYVDVFEDTKQFAWSTDNHKTGVHPDAALVYFLKKEFPDLDVRHTKNGQMSRIETPLFTVDDYRDRSQ